MQNKLYIGGQWVSSSSNETVDVINPATEEVFDSIASGNEADIDAAVAAAREAFDNGPWPKMSGAERGAVLRKMAEILTERLDELAAIEVKDNGKPFPEAQWDIEDTAGTFEFYAGLAEELDTSSEEVIDIPEPRFSTTVVKEPIGVAGAIIPWNYPLLMAAWKVAPALAAGCSMILKPSETTSLTALHLAEIAEQAGLPPGVFNVVTGQGRVVGQALAEHKDVDKLAFTGSVPVGSKIMKMAANDVKNISLELGGKSPLIVFSDCDIEKAVEWIMFGVFWNQGQVCSSTSRVLVEKSLYPALLERLAEETKKITIGPGDKEGVLLGPLVNKNQYDNVLQAIDRGVADGAKILTGGGKPEGFEKGYYVEPTIFTDMEEDS